VLLDRWPVRFIEAFTGTSAGLDRYVHDAAAKGGTVIAVEPTTPIEKNGECPYQPFALRVPRNFQCLGDAPNEP
jgi:4-alpha-glucanotransferase